MRRALAIAVLAACSGGDKKPEPTGSASGSPVVAPDAASVAALPPAPPLPQAPAGMPALAASITPEVVALGELLFWDTRLSSTGKLACATCHDPANGYAGATRQDTAAGKLNLRRAPALVNLAWQKELGWDGRYGGLAELLAPHARGQLGDDLAAAVARIKDVPGYRLHFARVGAPASPEAVVAALSAFVSTRYTAEAPWDVFEHAPGKPSDMVEGYRLFIGKAQCAVCHTPPLYTDLGYHRLGLIQSPDAGRGSVDPAQRGAFKTPTLRGAAQRTGFFHDGSAGTLDAAIDWHLAGGTGQGADRAIIDPALPKIALTKDERRQLGEFVRALSAPATAPSRPVLP